MNGFNLSDITDAKLGTTTLGSIYLGSTKLWPTHDYSQDYFTIESLYNNNVIGFQRNDPNATNYIADIRYSTDGNTWYLINAVDTGGFITLNVGDKIYIKPGDTYNIVTKSEYPHFTSTYDVNVYGNVNSIRDPNFKTNHIMIDQTRFYYRLFNGLKIVDASNLVFPYTTLREYCYANMFRGCSSLQVPPMLPATTLAPYCYAQMFDGCSSLQVPPMLPATTLAPYCYFRMFRDCTSLVAVPVLPATTLADSCYRNMFYGCTSLTTAPALPATTLAPHCYRYMFEVCSSLTTAPELPATTLTDYCYTYMFEGCSSLTTAPELPATTLAAYCYYRMFQNCTSLSYIKCLATNISASYSHYQWLYNVASNGKFVKPTSMTSWSSGENGIPSGWTVVNV